MVTVRFFLLGLMAAGLVVLVNGCKKSTTTRAAPAGPMGNAAESPADADSGPFAAGKKVFATNNCARCHTINGLGGGPGMAGGPGGRPPMAGGPSGPGGPGGGPSGPGGGPPGPGGPGGGRGGNKGPDLGKVGADATHTIEWLMQHVRDPKVHKPDSRMPPAGDKINETDLRALADYLASLK